MTKHLMIGAAAAALGLFATEAAATAVYDAGSSTTLTLVSVTNTTGEGDSEIQFAVSTSLDEEGTETDGEATAETGFTLNPSAGDALGVIQNGLAPGEFVSNAGTVSGTATDGTSSGFVSTAGDMFVENLSQTDTFEVTFELTYDMFASASVDDTDAEIANASAFVTVDSELLDGATGTLTQDGVVSELLSGVVLELALEPAAGEGMLSESASALITFVIAPGAAVNMFMFADVLGNGTGVAMMDMDPDAVPLPGALGFMVLGAAGLAKLRRREAA